MRLLGSYWRKLHRSVYAIAILASIHYWQGTKLGETTPVVLTITAAVLLLYRVWAALPARNKRADDGMQTQSRSERGNSR